nr:xylulose kinase-1 [Tanacetum cinerariifolium]
MHLLKNIPQITTVTNISIKFPYLKKGEYDIWVMKMQNFISSSDLLCWNIVLKGNSAKSMTTDKDGNLKIRPPVTAEEHQQVQREEKARTILLSALPDEHMGDFYHMIDARDIWNAIKERFGGNVESKKMQKFAAAVAAQEKQDLMTKLDNEIANQAKWNNSGRNLYKLIDSSMSVRTKRGLRLDKYIGEGELGIDDSKVSIFHTNSDDLEGQPIYNRFALVDHIKAVPLPLTGNYMPPSNIPDIDESQMVYGKKATDLSEIKTTDDSITHTNDSVLFDFSDRSSEPSTNDFQKCDSSVEGSQPNQSDHDTTDSISSVSAPASESRDTIVIDCDKQEDFPSVCSIEYDVKSSNTLCNKFGSFNKGSHFKKHKSCYVCGSYLHLIKDCDLHEQRFAKRNTEGKGILKCRPTGKLINPNRTKPVSAGRPKPVSAGRPNPVSAVQPNPVSASQPNTVSAGDGILGPRPLNIQPKSTYFHSFTHNNQQIIFPITHNSLYSLYLTGRLNGKTVVKPSAGWPWTNYGIATLIEGRLMPEGRLMSKGRHMEL